MYIYRRGVFRCGMWPVNRGYLPMSNVVTHSALTCKYFIKIIYNPFRYVLWDDSLPWSCQTVPEYMYFFFLTENPEENGVNGALEREKSENRICSRSDDRRKVYEQEKIQWETWSFYPIPHKK